MGLFQGFTSSNQTITKNNIIWVVAEEYRSWTPFQGGKLGPQQPKEVDRVFRFGEFVEA